MDEVRTMISTIVNFKRPDHSKLMVSEKLLLAIDEMKFKDTRLMDEMRAKFFEQKDLVSIGKIVPNLIREQDNLIFELMLPAELTVEENLKEAARILAPYLIFSNHVVFNFDEIDLSTALPQSVNMML